MNVAFLAAGVAAFLFVSPSLAADKLPERKVQGTTLTSTRDPAVTIKLPAGAHYLGADRWDLYGCCDAELHVFVEADSQKRVQRLYWIQFESYLPNNTYTYTYPFTEKLTHAGLLFDVMVRVAPTNAPGKPGSDHEHVQALVANGGYQMPAELMSVRLVNILDEAKRKELMFIYAEDPGANAPQKEALIQRALENIVIEVTEKQ